MRARHHLRFEVRLSGETWIGRMIALLDNASAFAIKIALTQELLYSSLHKESES
jgi:hypothetical protein